jgi:uncharacterized delta-60 repeat protein
VARVSNPNISTVNSLLQTPSCSSFGLDSTFGTGGKVATSFPGGLDTANDVAVQSDGKIVVAGSSGSDVALTRYNINGTLDPTFGLGGRVTTDFPVGMGGFGTSLVIQPDGKIVVAGSATDPNATSNSGFALVRYNTDGTLDSSFDGDGRVVTGFAGSNAAAEDIVLQPDGKLVVVGTSTDNTTFNSVFALARYNTNGSLDNSFDTDGRVTTDLPGLTFERANAVALQANGRIVVAGQGSSAFKLTRYNTDGSLDSGAAGDLTPSDAFGTSGIVTTAFGGTFEEATAVAIQSDGKIVAVGQTARSVASEDNFALARYNALDGSLDTTFDNDGKTTTDFGLVDSARDVVIQPDGKIVVAGTAGTIPLGSFFAIARYNTNGFPDATFDGDGRVQTDFSGGRFGLGAQGVALQADGRIVAAGDANSSGQRDFGVARYNTDGGLDTAGFGTLGKVLTDFSLNEETIVGMVVQPDGKIVAAGRFSGQVRINGTQDLNFLLARYNTDGTLDSTFGSGGIVSTDFAANSDDLASAIALQSDGRIIVVGQSGPPLSQLSFSLDTTFAAARYNTNGTLDPSFDGDGKVTTNFSTSTRDTANAVAIQANGKIVVAGTNSSDFALLRYNTDGSLDTNVDADPGVAFDTDGRLTTDFNGGFDSASAVVIQSDGKIVAAGVATTTGTSGDFALVRYNSDGVVDAGGFGVDGKTTTDFFGLSDGISGLVMQPNGKFVAAGSATVSGSNSDFALARYNSNGLLDTNSDADPAVSFDTDGKLTTDFGGFDSAGELALSADGKIVAAGLYFPLGSNSRPFAFFALARYNTDGSLDTGFGPGGKLTTDFFGINNQAAAVVIQGDGKVVAGGFADSGSSNDFALARYSLDCPTADVSIAVSPSSTTEDGPTNLIYTLTRTGATTSPLTVNFSVGGTATFNTDYSQSGAATFSSSSGTATFIAGSSTAIITIDPTLDNTAEPNETVILTVTSGTGYNAGTPSAATGTITNDDTPTINYSLANYTVSESGGSVQITVNRTGDPAPAVSVDFMTTDNSNPADFVLCSSNPAGIASSRCDFNTAVGTLKFATGEVSKTFNVLITQDSYVEGTETLQLFLSNPTGGAVLGGQSTSMLQIQDDVPETTTNPILDARNFVRQNYHDFLNREPDQPGWDFWTDNITKCDDPARRPAGQTVEQCIDKQRETTSAAFFLSPEFQYTGFYIYCLYKGSLGRMPNFIELMRDVQQVSRGIVVNNAISGAVIEQNRAQFETEFIQRPEFVAIYGALSNQGYVDKLFQTTGTSVSAADKQALVDGLNGLTETRATVLHKITNGTRVIAEGQVDIIAAYGKTFTDSQFTPAFVQMEYLGYLRRNSDQAGFIFWRDKMNSFGGDFLKAEMVKSFLMSPEYLQRFAAP